MKLNTRFPLHVLLFSIILIFQFSCSKDSDLLTDYVLSEKQQATDFGQFIVDDAFFIASSGSITLDVLANDNFENEEEVIITETTTPASGTVEINNDNTLTYTPDLETVTQVLDTTNTNVVEVVDTFTYTTEVVSPDETVSTETGNVTVTVSENRAPITGDNVYYVTTSGKSDKDGASEATAWNIQHAFSTANAGDVIYVKAGNYGNLNLITSKSGTAQNMIKFIGYQTTPGDIISSNGPTVTYSEYINNGRALNSSKMPLLQGLRTNNTAVYESRGMQINHNYIHIENFQFRYFDYGIYTSQSNNVFRNTIHTDMGDFNPANTYNINTPSANNNVNPPISGGGTTNLAANYKGQGIWIAGGSYNKIDNSITINGGARGFAIVSGTNNEVSYTEVWCDQNVNPTDYYLMVYGGSNNYINNVKIQRIGNLTHRGHGISLKCNTSNNTYENIELFNTSVELNINANYNTFTNVNVQGGTWAGFTGGIKLDSGSSYNTFTNSSILDGEGVIFLDSSEGDCGSSTPTNAGHDNVFTNLVVKNSSTDNLAPIAFHWNNQGARLSSSAYNNKFINCTFEGSPYVFRVDRISSGNEFLDCTFSNISNGLRSSAYAANGSLAIGATFTNCEWFNNSFPAPN